LGYSEAEILGTTGPIFFTEEDRAKGEVEKELETAVRDGRAEDERWHLRKDGSRFWASGVMTPFRDESGQPQKPACCFEPV
jgi:PAS domain S-box-containing protein